MESRSDPIQIAPALDISLCRPSATDFSYADRQVRALADRLSAPRLSKFVRRANGDLLLAIQYYEWNADLAASLYFPIQTFEVVIRNATVLPIVQKWGTNWLNDHRFCTLTPALEASIRKARDKETVNKNGFPISGPDVIAASGLGLWRELYKSDFWLHIWKKSRVTAFPNRNVKTSTTDVHSVIDNILKIRNRIAPQEPTLGSPPAKPGEKLLDRYGEILEAIGWVDENVSAWVNTRSTFKKVYNRIPSASAAGRSVG